MSVPRQVMLLLAAALLLDACAVLPERTPPLEIGLGQERLHLGMTVSEAMAANPELFVWAPESDRLAWLALPFNYRWENCRFLVSVFFFDNRLVETDFEAAGDVDACKTSILQKFPAQYGAAQKGEPTFANTIYLVKSPAREIDVVDFGPPDNAAVLAGMGYLGKGRRSAFGGVPPTPMERIFGVVFFDPSGPLILTQ